MRTSFLQIDHHILSRSVQARMLLGFSGAYTTGVSTLKKACSRPKGLNTLPVEKHRVGGKFQLNTYAAYECGLFVFVF